MIYFADEAVAEYAALGILGKAGYFASRAAPMGAVSADVVIATFYNFDPRIVRDAIPAVWSTACPEAIVGARIRAADAALRRLLGPALTSPEVVRAATLARRAAEEATSHVAGHPLFAGLAGLPWPDEPHLVLWHAQSCLREFRGDGHIMSLVTAGIGPVEALVMHVGSGEVPVTFLRNSRGWSDEDWLAGVAAVDQRGWLERSALELGDLVLSEAGIAGRQCVEDETDRLASPPYQALGTDGCAELRTLARPLSQRIAQAGGLGFPPP